MEAAVFILKEVVRRLGGKVLKWLDRMESSINEEGDE
jgi:hypothetical protein